MLLRFLILIHVCAAFPLKCPEPAQWSLRARSHCQDPFKYFCLKNDLINGHSENCTVIDFLQPGRKHVLRGGLDADICSSERYQPWPVNFYTNVSTNCIFLKSTCNDEGQVLYGNGDQNTDTTCRCDYTTGYVFLVKPRQPCFCVPSEEDCSCYLKTCRDSSYVLSSDYECIRSKKNISKHECKPIFHMRINTIANQSGIDHIVRGQTTISTSEEYRSAAAIFITSFLSVFIFLFIPLVVFLRHCYIKHRKYNIPVEIQDMDEQDVNRYIQHLKAGKVKRYHIKIMILGKHNVGKTSLMRRLLNESIDNVKSTDGIDIVKRCKVDINSGEWVFCKGDSTDDRIGMAMRKIDILNHDIESEEGDSTVDGIGIAMRKTDILNHDIESEGGRITKERTEQFLRKEDDSDSRNASSMQTDANKDNQLITFASKENTVHHTPKEEEGSINFTSKQKTTESDETENMDTLLEIGNRAKALDRELADCTFMDFAGHTEYYSTHQTFLTKNAIYLIVSTLKNGQDPFADTVPEQEKISFWIDNILCYATDETQTKKSEHRNPPIVMVCTGNEPGNIKDLNKSKEDLEYNFTTMLKNTKRISHIRGSIIHVSNITSPKEEFEDLRAKIFDVAKGMPVWGEEYPTRFINFERTLNTLRKEGKNVLKFEDVKMHAKKGTISLTSDMDVILFLKFQHQVGNLIFYEDERLKECVIINPSWLIDAFKCIVYADKLPSITFQPQHQTLLDFRETGVIRKEVIIRMLHGKHSEFHELVNSLEYVIGVMKKFDIIVEDNEDIFICPSAVTKLSSSFKTICEDYGINNEKCFKSPWLCLEFDFLPPALYNLLLVFCMRDSIFEKPKLFHEIGIFCFKETNAMKLCVLCKTNNTIAVQIWSRSYKKNQSGQTDKNISIGNTLFKNLSSKIDDITKKYEFIVTYTTKIKCGDSDYQATEDRYSEQAIENSPSGACSNPQHGFHDNFNTMFNFWLKRSIPESIPKAVIDKPFDQKNSQEFMDASSSIEYEDNASGFPKEETNFYRLKLLMQKADESVRVKFDEEFSPDSLQRELEKCKRNILEPLKKRRIISHAQWFLLFPFQGSSKSVTFNLSLMTCLIRHLKHIPVRNTLPFETDTSTCADLSRLKYYKKMIRRNRKGTLQDEFFEKYWTDISEAIIRLGGPNFRQMCRNLKVRNLNNYDFKQLTKTRNKSSSFDPTSKCMTSANENPYDSPTIIEDNDNAIKIGPRAILNYGASIPEDSDNENNPDLKANPDDGSAISDDNDNDTTTGERANPDDSSTIQDDSANAN